MEANFQAGAGAEMADYYTLIAMLVCGGLLLWAGWVIYKQYRLWGERGIPGDEFAWNSMKTLILVTMVIVVVIV